MQRLSSPAYTGAAQLCRSGEAGGRIPTANHVYADAYTDMNRIAPVLQALPSSARQILLGDYVEEVAADVLGAGLVQQFFEECFDSQEYDIIDGGDAMFRFYEEEIDGTLD